MALIALTGVGAVWSWGAASAVQLAAACRGLSQLFTTAEAVPWPQKWGSLLCLVGKACVPAGGSGG